MLLQMTSLGKSTFIPHLMSLTSFRFDEMSIRALLSADPNFRYCLAEGCASGQIHDTDTIGNIFRCNACNFRICTVCDVPFHTGQTCTRFNKQRREKEENDRRRDRENNKSELEVRASTTRCPGCNVPIHKYEACDHMTCELQASCVRCGSVLTFERQQVSV